MWAGGSALRRRRAGRRRPRSPAAAASSSSGTPAVPPIAMTSAEPEQAAIGRPPPRPGQPRLAGGARGRRARQVGEGREPGRGDPGPGRHRAGQRLGQVEGGVERPRRRGRRGRRRRARSPSRRQRWPATRTTITVAGTTIAATWARASRSWRPVDGNSAGGPAEIGGQAVARSGGDGDEHDEHDRRRRPTARAARRRPGAGSSARPGGASSDRSGGRAVGHGRGRGLGHVVPSRATAATTRSSSTVPTRRPPKPNTSNRPVSLATAGPSSAAASRSAETRRKADADGREQRPVHERPQDAAAVLVDDATAPAGRPDRRGSGSDRPGRGAGGGGAAPPRARPARTPRGR